MHLTRRSLLLSSTALAATASGAPEHRDSLQEWLATHAHPIRTVDANDEDFSDLAPIAAAIGQARVVQLGEPSHNAGSCFAAKARLVKYLHQRLKFDVVLWESGLYDVSRVDAALRAGEDAATAAQLGILRNWSASQECRPLFEYAKRTLTTTRPLVMAGFDTALTSPFANLAAELRAFAAQPTRPALRRELMAATDELVSCFDALSRYVEGLNAQHRSLERASGDERKAALARWELDTGAALRPNHPMWERFSVARARLAELLRLHERELARATTPARAGFLRRIVESLEAQASNLYQRFGSDAPPESDGGLAAQNRRDACNADNLRWLIEHAYHGRKVIVWAHNAHVMNAYYEAPAFKTIRLDASDQAMKPHGVFLAEWLGRGLYTIGFTAYQGEDGWKTLNAKPVVAAREGSVESGLNTLGHAYAFVDVENARGPMRQPQVMRVPKFDEVEVADPTRPYSGIFFIARLERASLITP